MDTCRLIFAETFCIMFTVCVRMDRGEGGQPNGGRYGQEEGS